MSHGPDAERARAAYERHARRYDYRFTVRIIEALQRRAIDALSLSPGDRVLDVACGTGGAFFELEERVGSGGSLVGVDLSAAMLERARVRVKQHEWSNVRLGARRYVTTFAGFDRPYALLAERLEDVSVERAWLRSMYVVSGRVPT